MVTILLTGFGPFPGAPFNPTGPLVRALARRRHPRLLGVRRIAHVFATRYDVVDRELPALIAREAPTIVLMFGLASRTRHVRVETCARNVRSRVHQDVAGFLPSDHMIAPNAAPVLPLRVPAPTLVAAARAAGVPAALSRDAGSYLCNYLCWRASEAASAPRGPRLVAFVHVPNVRPAPALRSRRRRLPLTLGDLVEAGEAIMLAALAVARGGR
jgi:pyroglutamyl-peptidase